MKQKKVERQFKTSPKTTVTGHWSENKRPLEFFSVNISVYSCTNA